MREEEEDGGKTADEMLPQWLKQLEELSAQPAEPDTANVPVTFMVLWGGFCSVALGGGAVVGYRAFEGSVAYEALDKLEASTPASVAAAARMAARAFGYGTALACGTAAVAVGAAWMLGVRSATDVGTSFKARLAPFDSWLKSSGDGLIAGAQSAASSLDGWGDQAAASWRDSWLGGLMRGRVERVVAHHEAKEEELSPAARGNGGN